MSIIITNIAAPEYKAPDLSVCLTTSLANYNAAANLDLVPVTTAEATCLQAYAGSIAGLSSSSLASVPQAGYTSVGYITGINSYASASVGNHYIGGGIPFLMKVRFNTGGAGTTIAAGVQFGYATTDTGAAVPVSNKSTLTASTDVNAYAYFLVKNPFVATPSGSRVRMFTGNASIGVRYGNNPSPLDIAVVKTGNTDITGAPVSAQANIQLAIQVFSL